MRTDCKISTHPGKAVRCKNACRLSFCKWEAGIHDLIIYREDHTDGGHTPRMARVIGFVSAPKLESDEAAIKDWLLVLALSSDGHHAYERWVDPDWVIEIRDSPTKFATWFFAEKLPYDAHTLRRLSEYGTLSEDFIDGADDRVKHWEEIKKLDRGGEP